MRTRAWVAVLGVAAVASAVTPLVSVTASRNAQAAVPVQAAEPATAQSLAGLMDKELHWGMTHAQVIETYNKTNGIFDREYAPILAKMQPGVAMQTTESERDSRKKQFERSYTQFEEQSGFDSLPIHSEFTYKNNESALQVRRDNKNRYMFFIKDKLWKVYDEIRLSKKGPLGATFDEATDKLGEALGVAGRARDTDTSQGVDFPTVDWQDDAFHLRMINREEERIVGVVLEDRQTLKNMSSLRLHKAVDLFAIDPSIAAVTRKGISDPNAAPERPDAGTKGSKK